MSTQKAATPFVLGMRDAFFEVLADIFRSDRRAVLLSADNGAPTMDQISYMPDQFRNVGIAEQQLVGMACGLALEGRRVWIYAIDPFVTLRCLEFIKLDMCAMNLPIVALGVGPGYAYDVMGPTHHGVGIVAALRCWPNLTIYGPADATTARAVATMSAEKRTPHYVRFDRGGVADLYAGAAACEFAHGMIRAREGSDLCIVATGIMVHQALKVADRLAANGITTRVVDLFRLKPIDTERLFDEIGDCPRVVTMEEDYLAGGMGSAIAELFIDAGFVRPTLRIGQRDQFVFDLGGRSVIWEKQHLDVAAVTTKVSDWLGHEPRGVFDEVGVASRGVPRHAQAM